VLVLLQPLHVNDTNISVHLTRSLAVLHFPRDAVDSTVPGTYGTSHNLHFCP